jgi:hypothetical protein
VNRAAAVSTAVSRWIANATAAQWVALVLTTFGAVVTFVA